MNESEFFKIRIHVPIIAWDFPIWYFFECCSERIDVYFHLLYFFESLQLFSHFSYTFGFSGMFFHLLNFAPKLFCFLVIRLLICLHAISPCLQEIFFSLFWNVLFCLYSFILSRYLFSHPFFASIFWFISSSFIVCFTRVAFFFFSKHVPSFFSLSYHFCLLS